MLWCPFECNRDVSSDSSPAKLDLEVFEEDETKLKMSERLTNCIKKSKVNVKKNEGICGSDHILQLTLGLS